MSYFKAFATWLLILLCAIANGALREAVLLPQLGKPAALVLSGVILSICILVVSLLFVRRLGASGTAQALRLGIFWLALTLMFEFAFGLMQGKDWPALLEAYTFKDGNIWPLVLLTTLLAPLIAVRVRPHGCRSSGG
jgi:hypothetical protein